MPASGKEMPNKNTPYRIGLDLGTNSLGWCLLDLDENLHPTGIRDIGVRIFKDGRDPNSGTSLAVDRRLARSARRRRDRYLGRRRALMNALIAGGLMPKEEPARKALEVLDPFALRAAALDEELPPHHLGRALFHLNQRRGFKSNRKADRGNDDEKGKIATGIDRLCQAMSESNARTYGEFLHLRRSTAADPRHVPAVRTRLRPEPGENAKGDGYDFYPNRTLFEAEFEAIWNVQGPYHPGILTDALKEQLQTIIFFQRELKSPEVGRCTFFDDKRLPKAHPLFQTRRLYEEVNALKIDMPGKASEDLTLDQRNKIIVQLQSKRTCGFPTLRKLLKLPPEARFNKESDSRTKLLGDEVRAELSHRDRFGPRWSAFDLETQTNIVDRLRNEQNETSLFEWLSDAYQLDAERAKKIAAANLPEGFGRLGKKATQLLIEELKGAVITYDKAVAKCGKHHPEMRSHSDMRTGEIMDALPYYATILERHVPPGTNDPDEKNEAIPFRADHKPNRPYWVESVTACNQ